MYAFPPGAAQHPGCVLKRVSNPASRLTFQTLRGLLPNVQPGFMGSMDARDIAVTFETRDQVFTHGALIWNGVPNMRKAFRRTPSPPPDTPSYPPD